MTSAAESKLQVVEGRQWQRWVSPFSWRASETVSH